MTEEFIEEDQDRKAEEEYPVARRTIKDTVFKKLFSDPENLRELASFLVGPLDDEVKIENNTIENILASNGLFNDLSFRLSKKGERDHIVLVEAQSKWDAGITVRMRFYEDEILKRYFREKEISEYYLTKDKMPDLSYFVLYPGTESRPETISLRNDLLQNPESQQDLRLKVITTKNAEKLAEEYLLFCQIYDYFNKRDDTTPIQAIRLAVKECIKRDILKNFLVKHEGEVYSMVETIFNQAEVTRREIAAAVKIAEEKGEKRGEERGEKRGEERGEKRGEKKGKLELVRELVKSGKLSLEEIASLAHLPLHEIEKLA